MYEGPRFRAQSFHLPPRLIPQRWLRRAADLARRRSLHLPVPRRPECYRLTSRRAAPEFRIASKHITGDIEGNESGDQRLRLVIHTSGNVDAARFRSVPDLLAHRRSHDEIRRGHRAGSFEEKRVISNRISEMRCVRAKCAHEIPFSQWRDGIAGDYVGRYSTSAIDDPATVRVESLALGRNRVLGVV